MGDGGSTLERGAASHAAERAPQVPHGPDEAPRRVLLLASRLLDTAAGRHCTDLALGLSRRGYEPVVCCFDGWGPLAAELDSAGIEIFPLRLRPGLDPTYPLALAHEIADRRVDVIHTLNARRAYVFGVLAGALARVHVGVATFRDVPPHDRPWLGRAGRLCGELVGTVVATSEEVAQALLRQRWVPPGKTIVIPDGVNVERFREASRRGPAREHWGVPADVPVIGAVLLERSPQERELVRAAWSEVRRQVPRAELLVSGAVEPIEGARAIGPFTDSPAFYAAIDVFCIPIAKRVVPLRVLEALAATVPIAASRAPEDEGRAPEGPWAFANLTPPGPSALATGIVELLQDRDAARALVREGASFVRRDFALEPHVAQIAALYR